MMLNNYWRLFMLLLDYSRLKEEFRSIVVCSHFFDMVRLLVVV